MTSGGGSPSGITQPPRRYFRAVFCILALGAGFLLGVILQSPWTFAFPVALAVWVSLLPWHAENVSPSYIAVVLGGSAALGVACGVFLPRLARRFANPS
jgi:hypothetical protein